jgi:hypothetical protein
MLQPLFERWYSGLADLNCSATDKPARAGYPTRPAARPARRLPAHPPLRTARQPRPSGQAGPLPPTPRSPATLTVGARTAGLPARPLPGPDRALAPCLPSLLGGRHAAHQDPARHGRPQSPSSLGRHIMMPHLCRRPSTSDKSREHAGFAHGLPGRLDRLQSSRLARWHGYLGRATRLIPLPPAFHSSHQNLPQPCQKTSRQLICGRIVAPTWPACAITK